MNSLEKPTVRDNDLMTPFTDFLKPSGRVSNVRSARRPQFTPVFSCVASWSPMHKLCLFLLQKPCPFSRCHQPKSVPGAAFGPNLGNSLTRVNNNTDFLRNRGRDSIRAGS